MTAPDKSPTPPKPPELRDWCWPLWHDWTKWRDESSYEKSSVITKAVFEIGMVQERRCKRCNAAQRREVKG